MGQRPGATRAITLAVLTSLGATAARASDDPETLDTVTVTAQRFSQNLQEVPIAVTAIGAEQLELLGVAELKDVTTRVPNLVLASSSSTPSSVRAFMRGGGNNDSITATTEQAVGFYVDDVYQARGAGLNLELGNIERIEVLRGPQGTLYGRNTMVGAIKVVTRRPRGDHRLEADATIGSYDYRRVRASGEMPLSDSWAVSTTALWSERDGRTYNLALGRDVNERRSTAARFTLANYDNSAYDLALRFGYLRDDGDGTTASALAPGSTPIAKYGDLLVASSAERAYNDYLEWNASVDWTLHRDGFDIQYIGSYIDLSNDFMTDLSGGENPAAGRVEDVLDNRQISHELKYLARGIADGRLDLIGGLYWFDEKTDAVMLSGTARARTVLRDVSTTSKAVFGQATWHITEALSAAVGARWSEDDKTLKVTLPNGSLVDVDKAFSSFTPRGELQYRFSKDVSAYLSVARGFKAGGFNGRAGTVASVSTPFDPEKVLTYELGLNSELLGERLRVNAAYYYNDFTDLQLTSFVGNTTATFIGNAGGAEVQGIEVEATAKLGYGFNAFATIATMSDRYTKLDPNSQPARLNSNDVPSTPSIAWTLGLDWIRSAGARGSFSAGADVSHRAGYQLGVSPVPRLRVPSVDLVNAYIGWDSEDGRWQVRLHGTNLGDERYHETGIQLGTVAAVVPAKPREWRLSARVTF